MGIREFRIQTITAWPRSLTHNCNRAHSIAWTDTESATCMDSHQESYALRYGARGWGVAVVERMRLDPAYRKAIRAEIMGDFYRGRP